MGGESVAVPPSAAVGATSPPLAGCGTSWSLAGRFSAEAAGSPPQASRLEQPCGARAFELLPSPLARNGEQILLASAVVCCKRKAEKLGWSAPNSNGGTGTWYVAGTNPQRVSICERSSYATTAGSCTVARALRMTHRKALRDLQ